MSRVWTLAAILVALAGAALGAWTFWAGAPAPRAATTAIACVLFVAAAINLARAVWLTGAGLAVYALGLVLAGVSPLGRILMFVGVVAFIAGIFSARRRA